MNNFIFDPGSRFLDPERILFAAGLGSAQTVADLGAGSAFYSLAAGKIVGEQGQVYAVDILEGALDHAAAEARLKDVRNLKTIRADLEQNNSCQAIPTGSVDLVILANIVHQLKNLGALFAETYRVLKTGGKVLVVEWNDQPGPIGPPASERINPDIITKQARLIALKDAGTVPADMYHYSLMFIK